MRVLHIITRMIIGGAQENTLYNCLDLQNDFGDEVILVTGPTVGPEGELLRQEAAAGLEVRQVEALQRAIAPGPDRRAYLELRRIIRDLKPDVVHTHSAKGGFLGRLAAWKENVPAVIHSVHGAPFHPYQSALARGTFIRCERFAARRCHHMICVADAMTDLMVNARVAPREQFTTIYSGMEVEPFLNAHQHRETARRELGLDDQTLVIGKIARLFHLKGHDDLLVAAAKVLTELPQTKFLLVGDGILRPQIEQQARELGISDRIIFTGLVPPTRIPYLLSAMDILTHTSLREGLARTLPQALLTGIPVVSYDIDGAREVCRSQETGFLIPPRDTGALAQALIRLGSAPETRREYGTRGQNECRQRFDHHFMTREIRNVYQQVLDAAPSRKAFLG